MEIDGGHTRQLWKVAVVEWIFTGSGQSGMRMPTVPDDDGLEDEDEGVKSSRHFYLAGWPVITDWTIRRERASLMTWDVAVAKFGPW
jgi:hypothetical protein